MTTINSEIKLSGICLMDGKETNVTLFPSTEKGIRFYNGDNKLEASVESVASTMNCVVLASQTGQQVRLIEHFMAAMAFSGIDCLDVCMDSQELPILDGSAKDWLEAIEKVGVTEQDTQTIEFSQPLTYSLGHTDIIMVPAENFKVSYLVNFNHPDLNNRWVSWDSKEDRTQVVEARTFGYLKDLEKFQKAGLALGASIDNTVGLTEDGYTVDLRFQYEPAMHKILDIIGDLRLTGLSPLNFKAHIIAKEAGHKTHVEFAKIIKNYIGD